MLAVLSSAVFAIQLAPAPVYLCNLTSAQCAVVPPGTPGAGSLLLCKEQCQVGYVCNVTTYQCEPKVAAGLDKGVCHERCVKTADPCQLHFDCGSCLADANCGWCSRNVTFPSGKGGGQQCASIKLVDGGQARCPAQWSSDKCTGSDAALQMLPATREAFYSQFHGTVMHATDIRMPSEFTHLADNVQVSTGGDLGRMVTHDSVGAFLAAASPPLPAAVLSKLTYAIPALMYAGAGQVSMMAYQTFTLNEEQGHYRTAYAGVMSNYNASSPNPSNSYTVAYAYGQSTADKIQQYVTYHVGCCSCGVGGCGTWIKADCHGCDRQQAVDDSPAQVAAIKQGLRASIHASFASSFPVKPPVLALAAPGVDAWRYLKRLLTAFVNQASVQHIIGQHSSSPTVTKVQTALKSIAEDLNVLKIPQVALTDVPAALRATAEGTTVPAQVVQDMGAWVANVTGEAKKFSGQVNWTDKDFVGSDGANVSYFSVHIFYQPTVSPYVDLVMASYQSSMNLEKLTISTTSHSYLNGSVHTDITEKHSPLSPGELKQFVIQWKYAVSDAILSQLEGRAAAYVSPRMRLMPFRIQAGLDAHKNGLVNGVADGLLGSVFKPLADIIHKAKDLWQGIVGGFGHTSQRVTIISQGGFSMFDEATDTYTIPGVYTKDTNGLIDAIMPEYSDAMKKITLSHMQALLFSHSTTDNATWYRTHIVLGKNQSAGGCGSTHGCAEFFSVHLNPRTLGPGMNNWALCGYKTDFELAPTIEMVTTETSKFWGLFSNSHDEIKEIPRFFQPGDETKLRQFMSIQCSYQMGLNLGVPDMKVPAFPPM